MVATTGDKEARLRSPAEHRRDGRDVGKMGPAMEGVIAQQRVPGLKRSNPACLQLSQQIADAVAHRAEMDRNVRCIGHKCTGVIEQGTGKIQPFADVHGSTALTETFPHLLGDRHEAMAEQLPCHRSRPARSVLVRPNAPLEQESSIGIDMGIPARLEHDAAGGLRDQGGTIEHRSGRHLLAIHSRHRDPALVPQVQRHRLRWNRGRTG